MTIISNNLSSFVLSNSVMSSGQRSHPSLTGYWHNWHTEAASFLPLRDVSSVFDVINVAFAVADSNRTGRLVFEPCAQTTPTVFKAELAALQSAGRKVLISVGGANGSVALETPFARRNFIDSLGVILDEYGFDGVDINLEGTVQLDAGDTDFRVPVSPSVIHLISALRGLKNRFGNGFMLSLAPQVACVQGGFSTYQKFQGSYLPVIEHLRDILDYVHIQHYNASSQKALDGQFYEPDEPDFHIAMAEMLLFGFPVADRSNHFFVGLQPGQVSIGFPARKAIVQNGHAAPDILKNLLASLAGGTPSTGRYQLQNPAGYAGFGALMTWSINWDAAEGSVFSSAARSALDALSG